MATAPPPAKNDPRKRVVGTAYRAKGAIPVDRSAYTEIGANSVTVIRDVVPQLANRQQASQVYQQMVDSDATVNSTLEATKIPVVGGDYFLEPSTDDQIDLDIAEFCTSNILEGQSIVWTELLEEVLTMYEQGFSVFEPVWELREWAPVRTMANRRQYTMLKKLAFRPQQTINKFLYDDTGGPAGVEHVVQNPNSSGQNKTVEIPIEKLLIFTNRKRGGNLEGRSQLRSAYPHWFYKFTLYKIDAIQKERHGIGVPDIQLPPGATEKDKKVARELGRNLRTNEGAYIVRPFGWEVGFARVEGNLVNALTSAEHHDLLIAKNVLVQFINMGSGGADGGRASAGAMLDLFTKSLRSRAHYVCEVFNKYLIPKLVAYNFDTDHFPKLSVRAIGDTRDVQMWSAALNNLESAGLLTPDFETENYVRGQIDIPAKLSKNVDDATYARDTGATVTDGSSDPADGASNNGSTKAKTGNLGKSTTQT